MDPLTSNTPPTEQVSYDLTQVVGHPPETRQRKFMVPLIVILITGVVIASAILGIYLERPHRKISSNSVHIVPTPATYTFKARVVYSEGNVWIDNTDKKIIKEEDLLDEGTQIVTDKDAKLVLAFDDGTVVRVGESSNLTLSELKPAVMKITENTGVLFARVNKNPDHKFLVLANQVTVESLGTAFSVENQEEVNVKVFESSVSIIKTGETEVKVQEKQQWQESEKDVKTLDDTDVNKDKFLSWSLKEENIDHPSPTAEPTKAVIVHSQSQITLLGEAVSNGVKLDWKVDGMDTNLGFKILRGEKANPTFPENTYVYLNNPAVRSYVWDVKDGKIWHFRVCKYAGDKCEVYSNDIHVTAPSSGENSANNVSSINLSGQKSDGKVTLDWNPNGNSALGYKVVWSVNSSPTYPSRDGDSYHYYSDPGTRHDEITGLEGGKDYHFRICEYLGGACGVYSNEITIHY
jgi:hypothetical protein